MPGVAASSVQQSRSQLLLDLAEATLHQMECVRVRDVDRSPAAVQDLGLSLIIEDEVEQHVSIGAEDFHAGSLEKRYPHCHSVRTVN